jgi:poly-gamma-glutamate synthesis protein (capsule biosynthesis protein)
VPTEPRVVGNADGVRAIADAGFNIVTLANNHAFDCLDAGFANVRNLLDELGVRHFGAGMNLGEAATPAIVEINGVRLAFLAAVDKRSGPYWFASPDHCGVAPLDMDRLLRQIRELRSTAHHVIVSLHWGEERFWMPSPGQIEQAHAFVDAGASMILGHHPHVIQGMETYHGAPILYSLGNFIADDIHYSDGDVLRWNRTERTGCVFVAEFDGKTVLHASQTPTYDAGECVDVDHDDLGARRIAMTNRAIVRGVTLGRYRRQHLWVKTIQPILVHLRWSELKKIRLRQLGKAFQLLFQSLRVK